MPPDKSGLSRAYRTTANKAPRPPTSPISRQFGPPRRSGEPGRGDSYGTGRGAAGWAAAADGCGADVPVVGGLGVAVVDISDLRRARSASRASHNVGGPVGWRDEGYSMIRRRIGTGSG